jgi:hypothetical protein
MSMSTAEAGACDVVTHHADALSTMRSEDAPIAKPRLTCAGTTLRRRWLSLDAPMSSGSLCDFCCGPSGCGGPCLIVRPRLSGCFTGSFGRGWIGGRNVR